MCSCLMPFDKIFSPPVKLSVLWEPRGLSFALVHASRSCSKHSTVTLPLSGFSETDFLTTFHTHCHPPPASLLAVVSGPWQGRGSHECSLWCSSQLASARLSWLPPRCRLWEEKRLLRLHSNWFWRLPFLARLSPVWLPTRSSYSEPLCSVPLSHHHFAVPNTWWGTAQECCEVNQSQRRARNHSGTRLQMGTAGETADLNI